VFQPYRHFKEATGMKPLNVTLLILLMSLVSCKDAGVEPQPAPPGRFYLETEYVNSAWRYVHRGQVIDPAGRVITYDLGPTPGTWQGSPGEMCTEEELWAKIHHNDTVRGSIPADTLQLLQQLAYASVAGTMSDTVGGSMDLGMSIISCYTLEAGTSLFRRTELRATGDMEYHNTCTSAVRLAAWMASR
jgi:hypothetical protein